jgi:hypothetical protein
MRVQRICESRRCGCNGEGQAAVSGGRVLAGSHRVPLARPAACFRQVEHPVPALPPVGEDGRFREALQGYEARPRFRVRPHRRHHRFGSPEGDRRKRGTHTNGHCSLVSEVSRHAETRRIAATQRAGTSWQHASRHDDWPQALQNPALQDSPENPVAASPIGRIAHPRRRRQARRCGLVRAQLQVPAIRATAPARSPARCVVIPGCRCAR